MANSVFSFSCDETDEALLQPFYYLKKNVIDQGMLSAMQHSFNYWLKIPTEKLEKLHAALKPLLTYCLIFDDICDNSSLRRGIPAAHLIYGIPNTVKAMTYVLYLMLQKLIEFQEPELVDICIEHSIRAYGAQGIEFHWRNIAVCPTEEQYVTMVLPKTASTMIMTFRMMQVLSNNSENFTRALTELGNTFQVLNDYLNLQSTQYNVIKGYCDDITSGSFTFPLIHAIQSQPNNDEILSIIKQRTDSYEVKKYCLSLLKESGTFDYTARTIKKMIEKTAEEFSKFQKNPSMDDILEELLGQLDPEAPVSKFLLH